MRLHLEIAVVDLADRFQISKLTSSRVILLVLDVIFIKLSPLIYWPERPELIAFMPMCFVLNLAPK